MAWLWRRLPALFGLFLLAPALAWAELAIPPVARVTDLTGTLSPAAIQAIEAELAALEAAKGSQLAVLVVSSTRPETIEQYAIRVAEAWRLGRKGVDDGVLLLVAKDDRALRIEVGYGLEGAIPDAVAKRVIEEVIRPHFREGDFQTGIQAGVRALVKLIEGEPLPLPNRQASVADAQAEQYFLLALGFIFMLGGVLRFLFGRLPAALVAGGIAFVGLWLFLGSMLVALFFAFAVFLLTLVGGLGGGVSLGGRGGGFGGGGLGGGGFSGGGGGFGGGGASGRW